MAEHGSKKRGCVGYGVFIFFVLSMIVALFQDFNLQPRTQEMSALSEAAVRTAVAQATNAIETATEAALASIIPTLTNTPTATPTNRTVPPTNTPRPTSRPPETTLYGRVNDVRARACHDTSTECEVLAVLVAGKEVTGLVLVAGTSVSGSDQWWQVEYQGREMYIHSSLLSTTRPDVQPQSSGSNSSGGGYTSSSNQQN